MMGRSHLAMGACAAAFTVGHIPLEGKLEHLAFIWLFLIGAILPDIDHGRSLIGRRAGLLPYLLKHRGITHSLFMCGLIAYGAYISPYMALWGLAMGYGVHILCDLITASGVELLWPYPRSIRTPFNIKTGGMAEYVIVLLSIVGTAIHFFDQIVQSLL